MVGYVASTLLEMDGIIQGFENLWGLFGVNRQIWIDYFKS